MNQTTSTRALPDALARAENLPSLPAVALEVLQLAQDENTSTAELSCAIARDPALSAKLLRLANSSLFCQGRETTSLQEATLRLGTKTVKLMALSFSLVEELPRKGKGRFDYKQYWMRSMVAAVAGRSLAQACGLGCQDEAFLCGLLSNLGQLVMVEVMPNEYEQVLAACAFGWPTHEQELEHLHFHRGHIAEVLFKNWSLPQTLCLGVRHMHDRRGLPPDTRTEDAQLVGILHMAELSTEVLCGVSKGAALEALLREARGFGIDEQALESCLLSMELEIGKTAELFEMSVSAGNTHQRILEEARAQIMAISLGAVADLQRESSRAHDLEDANKELSQKASTDKLTGLANRATFDQVIEAQMERRAMADLPKALGLIMLDIDHFKRFNDTYGHLNGDKVLRLVGHLLARSTRKGDLAARYGGEEFALVLPEVTPAELSTVCERVRAAIANQTIDLDGTPATITVSLGAGFLAKPAPGSKAEMLIAAADRLLYRAKELGRNRVVIGAASG